MLDYNFEINAMDMPMQNSTWWSYNDHGCIKLLSTKTIPHLLSLIDGWKISLWSELDPILKLLFFRNTFLRCLTQAVCLVQVVWCINLAGGSQFVVMYFEIRLFSLLFHSMFSKFLRDVVLPHDWPDNTLLVLSEQCFWFRPIFPLIIWRSGTVWWSKVIRP